MQRRRGQGQLMQRVQWQFRPGRHEARRPSGRQQQLKLRPLQRADSRQATLGGPSCQSLRSVLLQAQAAASSQHYLLPVSFVLPLSNSA